MESHGMQANWMHITLSPVTCPTFRRICLPRRPSCSESHCLARHPKASIVKQGWSKCAHRIWDTLDSASARVHQNIEWVRSWVENENADAAAALYFEWMNAKRLAQFRQGQKRHRPLQNKCTDVCVWMYRMKRRGMT